jgi:Right handed beta helix region
MNKFRFTINALAIAIFTLALASMAQAQATRTWVSGVGDDANPCSRTAPCKTFAGAISKTAPGGEIDALDPGGFGALTITKSITIDGGGGQVASVLVAGTNGIVVSAGANDVVFLNNLRFDGLRGAGNANAGLNGIRWIGGGVLNITNCVIFGFNQSGIDLEPNQATDSKSLILNTVVKNCGGDGVLAAPAGGGTLRATVEHSSFVECANGLHAKSGARVSARNCVFSLNNSNGIFSDASGGTFANVFVWASQISGNGGNGVQAGNGGNPSTSGVTIAQNQIDRNIGNGVLISTNGAVNTFTNNSIIGNGTDGCAGCANVAPGN